MPRNGIWSVAVLIQTSLSVSNQDMQMQKHIEETCLLWLAINVVSSKILASGCYSVNSRLKQSLCMYVCITTSGSMKKMSPLYISKNVDWVWLKICRRWLFVSIIWTIFVFVSKAAQWLWQTLPVNVQMEDHQVVQPLVLCCRCEKCHRSRATTFDKHGPCEEKAAKLGTISIIWWRFEKHSKYDRRFKDCEIWGLARTPCKSLTVVNLNNLLWSVCASRHSTTVQPQVYGFGLHRQLGDSKQNLSWLFQTQRYNTCLLLVNTCFGLDSMTKRQSKSMKYFCWKMQLSSVRSGEGGSEKNWWMMLWQSQPESDLDIFSCDSQVVKMSVNNYSKSFWY